MRTASPVRYPPPPPPAAGGGRGGSALTEVKTEVCSRNGRGAQHRHPMAEQRQRLSSLLRCVSGPGTRRAGAGARGSQPSSLMPSRCRWSRCWRRGHRILHLSAAPLSITLLPASTPLPRRHGAQPIAAAFSAATLCCRLPHSPTSSAHSPSTPRACVAFPPSPCRRAPPLIRLLANLSRERSLAVAESRDPAAAAEPAAIGHVIGDVQPGGRSVTLRIGSSPKVA